MEAGMFETPHRRALYVSCSTEHISASQGTQYPCSQNDLDESIFGFYNPLEARRYPEEALVDLESFFRPNSRISPEVEAAISHLQATLKIQGWKPDLIIKAFKNLDIVFFAGKLRGHTTFSWRCAPWWDEEEGIPKDRNPCQCVGNSPDFRCRSISDVEVYGGSEYDFLQGAHKVLLEFAISLKEQPLSPVQEDLRGRLQVLGEMDWRELVKDVDFLTFLGMLPIKAILSPSRGPPMRRSNPMKRKK
ncbi:hypothetical protein MMC22_008836 [Lobaria immixta]|nr:hypothetical protein [Lobaria immixta]